tara:strand:- start:122 stop:1627 length:1506 start_codon:yes stop_codon:yes gene_type:complete
MSTMWDAINRFAQLKPDALAIQGCDEVVTWHDLILRVNALSFELQGFSHQVLGLYADNSPDWIVIDLACHLNNIILLPLPNFLSKQQLKHALEQSGANAIIHADFETSFISELTPISSAKSKSLSVSAPLVLNEINLKKHVKLPENTQKITFTSGSTSAPKGVCLSLSSQINTAQALITATEIQETRHLAVLPFSTLLENIAGIYATLLSGGCVIALAQQQLGFNGSQAFELNTLLIPLSQYQPQSLILLPELLTALVIAAKQGWSAPNSIAFIAVGGSKVSPQLLQEAVVQKLPVYQGYGLSECASVVSLNTPERNNINSAGQRLDHVKVTVEHGEVVVSGNVFLGYIGQEETWYSNKVLTGDLGFYDHKGYLHITGRKKNLLVSSFGRNINPEWVESELLANGLLAQCVVFGDATPFCSALILARNDETTIEEIGQWVDQVNLVLPDYAQIKAWHRLASPLSSSDGLMTRNGRPIRQAIAAHYQDIIRQLYQGDHYEVF